MQRHMILVGIVFGLVILSVCLFTSFVFIKSFGIGGVHRDALYALAFFVTLLFITAFATSRRSSIRGRNYFYIFAMSVGGYGMYLFIMSIPLAIVLSIYSFSGMTVPLVIPTALFALAVVAGIIGHIQSWRITTTPYSIELSGLPMWWREKTAVLVTDTHFGLVRGNRFARKILSRIADINPDVIFHGGDFYDGPDIALGEITKAWKEVAQRIPTFYTSGNHERYGDYDTFIASIKDAGIIVLEDTKTTHEGMQIAGITYRNKSQAAHATAAINKLSLDPSVSSILINHPPTFHDYADAAGISLMLSGHTHNGQFWPGMYIARLIYDTYAFGSKRYNSMQAITSRGVGTAGPPMRLFNPPELVIITFKNKV